MTRLLVSLVALWHALLVVPVLLRLAARDRRSGRLNRAKARYLRCVALVPDSFAAHFGLGCVFLQEREFQRAEREFMLAEQISPARFRESRTDLPDVRPGGGRRGMSPLAPRPRTAAAVEDLHPAHEFWRGEPDLESLGDCVDVDEWSKFRRMGPISVDELIDADVDRVIQALYREPREPRE